MKRVIQMYSEQLKENMEITIWDNGSMTAKSESGVFYSDREMAMLKGRKVPPEIHILKGVFGGTIIKHNPK